jgi:hypothetical protein
VWYAVNDQLAHMGLGTQGTNMAKKKKQIEADPAPLARPSKEKTVYERRSLAMTPDQWAALELLAEAMGANAKGGPRRGQPSWRNLIAQLANDAPAIIQGDKEWEAEKQKLKDLYKEHGRSTPLIVRAGDMKA